MKGSEADETICLATVTSADFISCTLVMLALFLAHNQWFYGDIVIIPLGF